MASNTLSSVCSFSVVSLLPAVSASAASAFSAVSTNAANNVAASVVPNAESNNAVSNAFTNDGMESHRASLVSNVASSYKQRHFDGANAAANAVNGANAATAINDAVGAFENECDPSIENLDVGLLRCEGELEQCVPDSTSKLGGRCRARGSRKAFFPRRRGSRFRRSRRRTRRNARSVGIGRIGGYYGGNDYRFLQETTSNTTSNDTNSTTEESGCPPTCDPLLCTCVEQYGEAYPCATELNAVCTNSTIDQCVKPTFVPYYLAVYCPFAACIVDDNRSYEYCGCKFYQDFCDQYGDREGYATDEKTNLYCGIDECCRSKAADAVFAAAEGSGAGNETVDVDVGRALCLLSAPSDVPSMMPSGPTVEPTQFPTAPLTLDATQPSPNESTSDGSETGDETGESSEGAESSKGEENSEGGEGAEGSDGSGGADAGEGNESSEGDAGKKDDGIEFESIGGDVHDQVSGGATSNCILSLFSRVNLIGALAAVAVGWLFMN